MKRIILGLSLVLMLVQNGFAKSDAEYDKEIRQATLEVNKQIDRCNKEADNHRIYGNPAVCEKALKMIQKDYPNEKEFTSNMYLNGGLLYETSKKNYIKAYEYFMKSAKLGNTGAQIDLDILCRNHSWVCKWMDLLFEVAKIIIPLILGYGLYFNYKQIIHKEKMN